MTVSLLHINPRLFVALYNTAAEGNEDAAYSCQKRVTQIMELVLESFARRPETSTLFHFLNYALRTSGVCENTVLEHEGDCPDWLAAKAAQAMSV